MASQVLSGSSNATYTNSTGQNVRLVINFMATCTSMSWAGVTVTGSSATVSKDAIVMKINGNLQYATAPSNTVGNFTLAGQATGRDTTLSGLRPSQTFTFGDANIFYVPTTITSSGDYPVEIVLASGQSFSATCGAYNILVIKEDGT